MGRGGSKSKQKQKRQKRKTEAELADKYALYQEAVQEPEADVPLIARAYKKVYGRKPRTLREDFCGTALLCTEWVKAHSQNRAWGIDLDPEPLQWGLENNVRPLNAEQQARIKLIEGNVLDVGHEKVDVTAAFNFSYFLFRERPAMLDYLRKARASLGSEGMLVLDAYGGSDAIRTMEESRELDDFDYVWDQHSFDPISNHGVNYIHFEMADGSEIRRAFSYEWRIWSIPELRELLIDAGFSRIQVLWEGTDRKSGEPNGVFTPRETAPDDPAWVCYILAVP